MDNELKPFVRAAKQIRLSEAERSRMRNQLETRLRLQPRPSPWSFIFVTRMQMVAAALVLVVLGGGTALAEGSVPGDVLYSIKIGVTEPARSLVAMTPTAKVVWETERAERRLAEAELLAATGSLDEETQEDLSARFEIAFARAQAGIEELQTHEPDEAVEAATELAIALDSHSRILSEITEAGLDEDVEALHERIVLKIETLRNKRTALRLALANSVEAPAAGARTLAMVSDEAEEAIEDFTESRTAFDAESELAIDERVALINAVIDEGKAHLTLGAYGSAFENFERARDLIGTGQRLIKAKERLEGRQHARSVPPAATTTMRIEATTTVTSTASTTDEEADESRAVVETSDTSDDVAPTPLRIDLGL